MDYAAIETLRDTHPAWRMLRADQAPLLLSFLGRFFVDESRGASPAGQIIDALDDELYVLNSGSPDAPPYPRPAADYLADWAAPEYGYLRRFYPLGSDEIHYDATPALEKAYAWVQSLQSREFVDTESRLQTAIDLLRQIDQGTESDPERRLRELERRKQEIENEIEALRNDPESGLLDRTAVRDRYQQFAATARELLSDFREVEENFRELDRSARERIATWDGSKGELLGELLGGRSRIDSSDQGRSFQAFYDLLLSSSSQEELSNLLERIAAIEELGVDGRMRHVHHSWAEAAERTQETVRRISGQLRRFTDDKIVLENRRVLDLVREIEATALRLRDAGVPSGLGLEFEETGVEINLATERPLHSVRPAAQVDSLLPPAEEEDVDTSLLAEQVIVDPARLAEHLRALIPARGTALLEDIVEMYPVENGVAELITYLALDDDDIEVVTDPEGETVIEYYESERPMRARMPRVEVRRT
ncbi:DUF3375 domain-containing protein [Dietzia aerolata]|uniref:DUF3375 domain-containing protein n=1 Tax=Dietzia aerolata TaxID=595984 RepID=A0ABV5JQX5_9ACTN|nr:DUF3375 domain-containing protein [Dietzia aerolata]